MVFPKTKKYFTQNLLFLKKINIVTRAGIALFLAFIILTPYPIYALSDEEELQSLNQQIEQAQSTLNSLRSEKASLANDLAAMDLQISTIQKQINATQAEINIINKQIAELNKKIKEAEEELARQREIMDEYLRTMYIEGQVSTLELIAESSSFSEFVDRSEYLGTMQEKVQETADKILALKSQLNEEKNKQEVQKAKTEQLRAQQVAQRSQIDAQRNQKAHLMSVTAGNEAKYKSYVSDLQRKFNNLQNEIWSKNTGFVSLGHVNKGQVIGTIGNSGYSTGCHLHFEIRNSSYQHVDPAGYFGDYFAKPVNIWMNVPYGYSAAYFPGVFHTGQDYADGCAGTAIHAAADGEIVKRISGRPNTYPYSVEYGNYVIIRHTNGMYSLYGHMR